MARKTRKFRGGKGKGRGRGLSLFTKKKTPRRTSSIRRSAAVKVIQRQFIKKRAARVAKIVKTQKERKSKCSIEYNKCMGYSSNRSS